MISKFISALFAVILIILISELRESESYFPDIADESYPVRFGGDDFDDIQISEEIDVDRYKRKKMEEINAVCVIGLGNSGVSGELLLKQKNYNGPVIITGEIIGLPPNTLHGFHVHQKGDIRGIKPCDSTGSHFNPFNVDHGGPTDAIRHIGDLGNIRSDSNGKAIVNIEDKLITLRGPISILGRAFVLHENIDDLGRGETQLSKTTGNAGARIACGLIGIL